MSAARRCPTCGEPVAAREQSTAYPFCSSRCRLADLGKWIDEDYRVPAVEQPSSLDDGDSGGEPQD